MPKFIQVTVAQGSAMQFNPDHIEIIAVSDDPDCPGIIQVAGKPYKVKQSVDQIHELIRQSGNRRPL